MLTTTTTLIIQLKHKKINEWTTVCFVTAFRISDVSCAHTHTHDTKEVEVSRSSRVGRSRREGTTYG
jgi:hypothetical protein